MELSVKFRTDLVKNEVDELIAVLGSALDQLRSFPKLAFSTADSASSITEGTDVQELKFRMIHRPSSADGDRWYGGGGSPGARFMSVEKCVIGATRGTPT